MQRSRIKRELAKRGLNLNTVAKALDVSRTTVTEVAARRRTSRRVAEAIATALDLPIEEVFPDVPSYLLPSSEAAVEMLRKKLEAA